MAPNKKSASNSLKTHIKLWNIAEYVYGKAKQKRIYYIFIFYVFCKIFNFDVGVQVFGGSTENKQ